MADRFVKFTVRARRVLTLAQEEAQRFNHNYIGTEHLLLGLVREGDGVAARALANLGVKLEDVRKAVEHIIGPGDRAVLGEIGLTPRGKKVIELAVDEARRLNHHYIGTEHLALGLVREGEGVAAGVLESLGVNLERLRLEVQRVLATERPATGDPSATLAVEEPGPELRTTITRLSDPGFNAGFALAMALSPEMRTLLQAAWRQSVERGAAQILPGDAVLALLGEDESILSRALTSLSLDRAALTDAIKQLGDKPDA